MDLLNRQYREKIVSFGADGGLIGVLCVPSGERADVPHVVLLNSGLIHRVGASRLHVGLARTLAADGITTLRFDLSGIGDSERQSDTRSLQESVERDITAALAFLGSECGAMRFVLAGLCSGAYDAFQMALADSRVAGAVLIDLPGPFQTWRHIAHHLGARAFRLRSWRNPIAKLLRLLEALVRLWQLDRAEGTAAVVEGVRPRAPFQTMQSNLDALLARNVRLYFIFTAGVPGNYNHRSQFRHRFPRAAAHEALSLEFLPESDHTFPRKCERSQLIGLVRDWILRTHRSRAVAS